MKNEEICAYCGKPITSPQPGLPDQEAFYCSFVCEAKSLYSGFGVGLRWFGVSLAWGLVLAALIVMVGWVILGNPVSDPPSYYGLVVVLAFLAGILSVLRKRVK